MAKHRNRAQKVKTEKHRSRVKAPAVPIAHELQVQKTEQFVVSSEGKEQDFARRKAALQTSQPSLIPPAHQSLLRVDQALLQADLRRSVLVSVVLIALLIGIFWLVRYNGLTSLQSWILSFTQLTGKNL